MDEKWKPVCGYEGLYEISDEGRVRSLDKFVQPVNSKGYLRKGRILKSSYAGAGYPAIVLYKVGKGSGKTKYIHALAAEAFLGPVPNGMEIDHKDTNKTNNRISNLRYMTHAGNIKAAIPQFRESALRGESNFASKLTEKKVLELRRRAKAGEKQKVLAIEFGVHGSTISRIVNKKKWSHI